MHLEHFEHLDRVPAKKATHEQKSDALLKEVLFDQSQVAIQLRLQQHDAVFSLHLLEYL